MKYLTVEEIIQTHNKLIEQFGGEKGIVDKSSIDFIVDKVQSSKNPRFITRLQCYYTK